MRSVLVSIAVGLAGLAAVAVLAFAVVRVALPAPAQAARAAADAEEWFHNHRFSVDVFHAGHHRFEGACLRGWFLQPHGHGRSRHWRGLKYGSQLALTQGPVALATGRGHIVLALGHPLPQLPSFMAAAIGCSGSLSNDLTSAAQAANPLTIERAYAANQPALALELHLHDERLTIYLSPHEYRPLVVIGAKAGRIATARLYLTPLTPASTATFHELLRKKGIHLPH